MTAPDGCHEAYHDLGVHAPAVAACIFPKCTRTPDPDSLRCEEHRNVRVSSTGSWTNDSHLEGGHG